MTETAYDIAPLHQPTPKQGGCWIVGAIQVHLRQGLDLSLSRGVSFFCTGFSFVQAYFKSVAAVFDRGLSSA
jgi:hypothetical protein